MGAHSGDHGMYTVDTHTSTAGTYMSVSEDHNVPGVGDGCLPLSVHGWGRDPAF